MRSPGAASNPSAPRGGAAERVLGDRRDGRRRIGPRARRGRRAARRRRRRRPGGRTRRAPRAGRSGAAGCTPAAPRGARTRRRRPTGDGTARRDRGGSPARSAECGAQRAAQRSRWRNSNGERFGATNAAAVPKVGNMTVPSSATVVGMLTDRRGRRHVAQPARAGPRTARAQVRRAAPTPPRAGRRRRDCTRRTRHSASSPASRACPRRTSSANAATASSDRCVMQRPARSLPSRLSRPHVGVGRRARPDGRPGRGAPAPRAAAPGRGGCASGPSRP